MRVLLIDDLDSITFLLSTWLRAHGYETQEVNDSRFALAAAREFHPDVILLDIAMPHLSGYDVARAIRADELMANVPIIAVTAFDSATRRSQARDAGIDHQVTKPCSLPDLLILLGEVLNPSPTP